MSFNPREDIGSPGFVYDKIYSSYKELSDSQTTDGIMIGRYVIVLYEREIDNNIIHIKYEADGSYEGNLDYINNIGYWDTAIFQKQYNSTQGEHYEFITYLGIFGDTPPAPNSIILIDNNKNINYSYQNNEPRLQVETQSGQLTLNHKKYVENSTNFTQLIQPQIVENQNGTLTFTIPPLRLDNAGHVWVSDLPSDIISNTYNLAELTVEMFPEPEAEEVEE